MPLWNEFISIISLNAIFKPKHACALKPEVLKSGTLKVDYSRAPCLGADQKTRGLCERDWLNEKIESGMILESSRIQRTSIK